MRFVFNDGGRSKAGFKGVAGDCVCRAITIAENRPYKEIYDELNELGKSERLGKRKKGKSSARNGVYRNTLKKYLKALGWTWVPTMFIGSGCRVHLREDELPKGTIIVSLSRHIATVKDGVLHDLGDCSRDGTRCVYGYWIKEEKKNENVFRRTK